MGVWWTHPHSEPRGPTRCFKRNTTRLLWMGCTVSGSNVSSSTSNYRQSKLLSTIFQVFFILRFHSVDERAWWAGSPTPLWSASYCPPAIDPPRIRSILQCNQITPLYCWHWTTINQVTQCNLTTWVLLFHIFIVGDIMSHCRKQTGLCVHSVSLFAM